MAVDRSKISAPILETMTLIELQGEMALNQASSSIDMATDAAQATLGMIQSERLRGLVERELRDPFLPATNGAAK